MPEVIIIADDLSGAADTGVAFVKYGYQVMVVWHMEAVPLGDVLVFSTESRHIAERQAVTRVQMAVSGLAGIGDSAYVYKKIDSTLRGHPAAELTAVMDGCGMMKALVAPAFPAQKRITVSGIHYVSGVPLDQTTYSNDKTTANIREHFSSEFAPHEIMEIRLETVRSGDDAVEKKLRENAAIGSRFIVVADAETQEDLNTLARAGCAQDIRLYCGSAGLADALAQTLRHKETAVYVREFKYKGVGILGVVASRRDTTLRQIAFAEENDIPVFCPEPAWFLNPQASAAPAARYLQRHLETVGMAILAAHQLPLLPGNPQLVCERFAEVVGKLMMSSNPAGLVITGGDMAIALSTNLEANALLLRGEVQSGIPWGYFMGGRVHGCPLVTKAGGFGEESALVDAMTFVESIV